MGRIAEALKRAQEERAQRLGRQRSADSDPSVKRGFDTNALDGRVSGTDITGVSERASIFDARPPRPFPIVASPVAPEAVDPRVVAFHDPTCAIAEKYRSVRTRLLTGNPTGSPRVFAITSSLALEGKTVTAGNLSFSLAELHHLRVAMIDLDFRQRGLSRLFQVDSKPGIAEVLRGEKALADVCLSVVRDNLYLVPAGDPTGSSPTELLTGAQPARVFKELNERFHYTLIDTPPVNTAADIGLIAPLCHSVVLVIRMNRTPEALLRRCIRLLQANHVTITGSILAGYCDRTMAYSDPHDYYESD